MNTHLLGTILLELLAIIFFAKIAGWLCHKVGQSAVLGELIVGLVLGPSLLNFINPQSSEIIVFLAEFGVVILLFEVGLESNIYKLLKVGFASALVACVGVVLPFASGYFYYLSTGATSLVALFVGATLTATSVGITMRIFSDMRKIGSNEGKIILGAAIIDDILGLIILSILVGIAEFGRVSLLNVGKISLFSIIFLASSIFLGIKLAPCIQKIVKKLRIKNTFVITAMIFALGLAYVANYIGLATIVGAFAAGLILETTEHKEHIRKRKKPLADIFVPIFFVYAGVLMDLHVFSNTKLLVPMLVLFFVAVTGKILAGWAAIGVNVKKYIVGIGMVPRGEVGLIFATFGLTNNVIGTEVYAVLVVVIMLTTFVTPPFLSLAMKKMD